MEFVVNFFGTNKIEKNIEIDEEILDQVFKSSDEIFWYPEFPMNCDGFRYWFLGDWAQNCYYVSTRTLTNYSYEFLHEIQSLFSVQVNGHFNIWRIRKIARNRDVSCVYEDISSFPEFREKCQQKGIVATTGELKYLWTILNKGKPFLTSEDVNKFLGRNLV